MKSYHVRLIGETPLLMHWDNLEWAERMDAWRKDPRNKKDSVAGDDRSPAFRWLGNLYCDYKKRRVVMPADNLQTMLREGGAKVPTGKRSETYKKLIQAYVTIREIDWAVAVGGKEIDYASIMEKLSEERDFSVHTATVESYGFELLAKRAKIGNSKHVRVRPRFPEWSCEGTIDVLDESVISETTLRDVLDYGGVMCGIGDWRPSSPKSPGQYGKFRAEIKEI